MEINKEKECRDKIPQRGNSITALSVERSYMLFGHIKDLK